jgi:tetratricopeptide (TPR) repeat protein
MRRSRARASCWLVTLALLASSAARASVAPTVRGQAKAHLDRGLALYQSRAFAAAAAEFEATYVLQPHRDVMYVWAQALRLAGQCALALELYQRFLASDPPRREAERARANQTRCVPSVTPAVVQPTPTETSGPALGLATPPGTDPPPAPSPSPSGPAVDLSARPAPGPFPAPGPRQLDRLDKILLGSGVVAAAIGGGFYLSARSEHAAARAASSYPTLQEHADAARTRERIGWVGLAAGSALLLAGLLRYALR